MTSPDPLHRASHRRKQSARGAPSPPRILTEDGPYTVRLASPITGVTPRGIAVSASALRNTGAASYAAVWLRMRGTGCWSSGAPRASRPGGSMLTSSSTIGDGWDKQQRGGADGPQRGQRWARWCPISPTHHPRPRRVRSPLTNKRGRFSPTEPQSHLRRRGSTYAGRPPRVPAGHQTVRQEVHHEARIKIEGSRSGYEGRIEMSRSLQTVTEWADTLRSGQIVDIELAESFTVSVGLDSIHVTTPDSLTLRVDGDAESNLLMVLWLREMARTKFSELSTMGHSNRAHTVRLDCPITCLGLSQHACNPLKYEAYGQSLTVRNLVALTEEELLDYRNLGKVKIAEIKTKLAEAGFHLAAS